MPGATATLFDTEEFPQAKREELRTTLQILRRVTSDDAYGYIENAMQLGYAAGRSDQAERDLARFEQMNERINSLLRSVDAATGGDIP